MKRLHGIGLHMRVMCASRDVRNRRSAPLAEIQEHPAYRGKKRKNRDVRNVDERFPHMTAYDAIHI